MSILSFFKEMGEEISFVNNFHKINNPRKCDQLELDSIALSYAIELYNKYSTNKSELDIIFDVYDNTVILRSKYLNKKRSYRKVIKHDGWEVKFDIIIAPLTFEVAN